MSDDANVRPPRSLAAPPLSVDGGERALPIVALILVLVVGVLAIFGFSLLYTLGGASGDYSDVMQRLPADILLRQAWLPQLTVGLLFVGLLCWLGWGRRARLALPSTLVGWAIGLVPCVVLLAAIDYGYLQGKGGYTLPVVFLTFLTVGFTEELGFRGIGIAGFQQVYSLRRSWLLASGLFGVAHIVNVFQGEALTHAVGQVVVTTLMGLVFGLLAIKSGSLILAMVAHGLWDVMAVSRLMKPELSDAILGGSRLAPLVAGAAILALVGVATGWRRRIDLSSAG